MNEIDITYARQYTPWLWGLWLLFVFRVLAQWSLTVWDVPFLPSFNEWYSGTMPYPQLVFSQVLIAIVMAFVAVRFTQGKVMAKRSLGIILLIFGSLYFTVMLIRLVVGFMGWSDAVWFHRPIPSFFHLVLASFVLLVGHFHLTGSRQEKLL